MELEKQRGISVTSSALQFEYQGYKVNILDTPGHQDFSEDTYRTLMAADSAVMLIDATKGVEEQTRKLFRVCKQRGIPIFTFINKMDRYGKTPLELLEEIENVLGIPSCPMNWPVGFNGEYLGICNRERAEIEIFEKDIYHGQKKVASDLGRLDDPVFSKALGTEIHKMLLDDLELLSIAGNNFDKPKVMSGELTPVFFGSAMTNFGVQSFLEDFLKMAPPPSERLTLEGSVTPSSEQFSAFVFKIQANMNPAHRDRLAFIRICSGKFERGMTVLHVQSNKPIKLAQPQQMMANERVLIEDAYPGDVVGLYDPGIFSIGDTLSSIGQAVTFADFPVFPPEVFARVRAKDTMKRKQFVKGITQLTQEGAVQVFREQHITAESFIIGSVGILQFEVLEYRLKNEYGVDIALQHLPYTMAKWIVEKDFKLHRLKSADSCLTVKDKHDWLVVLFQSEWNYHWVTKQNPNVVFRDVSVGNY
jgi:peptide chain release factor 3